MLKNHFSISCFSIIVFLFFGCSFLKADTIIGKDPSFINIQKEYILGEQIMFFVYLPESRYNFEGFKSVRLERPLMVNKVEKYTVDHIPVTKVNSNLFSGTINTNLEKFNQGEYKLVFNVNKTANQEETIEKSFHVGSIEITDEKIDFSMINSRGASKADITLNSSLLSDKSVKLFIRSDDSFIKNSNLFYKEDLIVHPGKNEYSIQLKLEKKDFDKHIKLLENQEIKDKFKVILKSSSNQIISTILLPSYIVIGSWIDYNLEIMVMLVTIVILSGVFLYYLWKINQNSNLFGTLIMKKPKKRKTHVSSESWNLSVYKERRVTIGSSSLAKINVPFINGESAIIYSLGKVKQPSMWIKPIKNQELIVNHKVITTDIKLNDGDDIEIDGYLFSWEK